MGWCNVLTSFIPFDDYGIEVNHHHMAVWYNGLLRVPVTDQIGVQLSAWSFFVGVV